MLTWMFSPMGYFVMGVICHLIAIMACLVVIIMNEYYAMSAKALVALLFVVGIIASVLWPAVVVAVGVALLFYCAIGAAKAVSRRLGRYHG
jgi:hypothetical protein